MQTAFETASHKFLTATGGRFFLDEFTILLPSNWTENDGDWNIEDTTSLSYDDAHIRVAPENPVYGSAPYVKHDGTCGQPGRYMHLTPSFISNETLREQRYGDVGE